MVCLIYNNLVHRQHSRNVITSIIVTTAVLLSLTAEAADINDESLSLTTLTPPVPFNRRSCCMIKNFSCTNDTPAVIECSAKKPVFLLLPHKNPEDNFTFTSDGGIKTLVTNQYNYSEPEFCIGWKPGKDNKTYPIALVCYNHLQNFESWEIDQDDQFMAFIISGACLLCSVFFAFITLVIYCLLPWLRDLQGKIIMSLLFAICIGYSTLGIVQLLVDLTDTVCIITGFMVYYWCFATFTWLHISCFNIWRTVVLSRSRFAIFQKPNLLFALYSAFAWGVPVLFLITALTIEFAATDDFYQIKPQMGESRCWFHSRRAIWTFFYGPLLIIITSNIFYFMSVVNRLYKIQKIHLRKKELSTGSREIPKNNEIAKRSIKRLKKINKMMSKNKLYLKLFFAMGITFIFELISELYINNLPQSFIPRILFQIMDIVNALQGLILFIVLILTRRKVLESLFKKFKIPIKYLPFKNDNTGNDEEDEIGEDEENENEDDEDFMTDDDEQNLTGNPISRQQNPAKITEQIQMT